MVCLDTTVLLDLAGRSGRRVQERARQRVRELHDEEHFLVTSRFNIAELCVGIERSANREREIESVQRLTAPLAVLEFDERGAQTFGRIVAHLQSLGTPIGDMDALIASVALAHGHSVVTRNERHFHRVPGLAVETY
jgi:tRNA(fMet)-specific endonuclease VapC